MSTHILLQFQSVASSDPSQRKKQFKEYFSTLSAIIRSDSKWSEMAYGLNHCQMRTLLTFSESLFENGHKASFQELSSEYEMLVWKQHKGNYINYPIPDMIAGWSALGLSFPYSFDEWTKILPSLEQTLQVKGHAKGWKTVKEFKNITDQIDMGYFHGALSALNLL